MGRHMLRQMTVPTGQDLEGRAIPDDPWGRLLLRTGVEAACDVIALRYGAGLFGRVAFAGLCGQVAEVLVPRFSEGQEPRQFQRQAFDQLRRQKRVPQAPQDALTPIPQPRVPIPGPQDPLGDPIDQPPILDPTPQTPDPVSDPQAPTPPQAPSTPVLNPFRLSSTAFLPIPEKDFIQIGGFRFPGPRNNAGDEFGYLSPFINFAANTPNRTVVPPVSIGFFVGDGFFLPIPSAGGLFSFDLGLNTTQISFEKQALQKFFKPMFKWANSRLGWALQAGQAFQRFDPKGVARELQARPALSALVPVFLQSAVNITGGALGIGGGSGAQERTVNQFLANAARSGWSAKQAAQMWAAVNHFGGAVETPLGPPQTGATGPAATPTSLTANLGAPHLTVAL